MSASVEPLLFAMWWSGGDTTRRPSMRNAVVVPDLAAAEEYFRYRWRDRASDKACVLVGQGSRILGMFVRDGSDASVFQPNGKGGAVS